MRPHRRFCQYRASPYFSILRSKASAINTGVPDPQSLLRFSFVIFSIASVWADQHLEQYTPQKTVMWDNQEALSGLTILRTSAIPAAVLVILFHMRNARVASIHSSPGGLLKFHLARQVYRRR